MTLVPRLLKSITRNPGKSIIFFLIFLIVGTLLFVASLIYENSKVQRDYLDNVAPRTITMDVTDQVENYPSADELRAMGESPYVRLYDFSLGSFFHSELKLVEHDDWVMTGHPLTGVDYAPVLEVEEGHLVITEGSTFTQDEVRSGEPVVLISKELSELNDLKVGDQVKLLHPLVDERGEFGEEAEYWVRVQGIYDLTRPDNNWNLNQMITVNPFIEKVEENQREILGQVDRDEFYRPIFILKDKDQEELFLGDFSHQLPEGLEFVSNKSTLETIRGHWEALSSMGTRILLGTFLGGALIISVLSLLFLKDRRYELGVYLSLGESKKTVSVHYFLELLLIFSLAVLLSLGIGFILSKGLLNSLMIEPEADSFELSQGVDLFGTFSGGRWEAQNQGTSISTMVLLLMLGSSFLTLILGSVVGLLYVFRLSPKKLMMP